MKAKSFLKLLSAIFTLLIVSCKGAPKNKVEEEIKRPNILVILCDDLGYSDVGFNGAKDIPTPEIDALANNGTIFSSGYVTHPFCGPSRAGLMTGRYPHMFGSQFNIPHNSAEVTKDVGIPLEEIFISKTLQEAGYYTGAIGKWHLGAESKFHPNERGFDDFFGFLGGGHKYFPEQYKAAYKKQQEAGEKVIWDYLQPLEHNGVDVDETEYLTDAFSREAVRFVNDASEKEKPFFLYLAYNAPHSPLEGKKEDLEKFSHIKDEKRRNYAAMVYAVDRGVGNIVSVLKKNEELENTLIVFLSDNGGKLTLGATNTPLREGKGSTCEGGFRVPMFFHWPGKVPSGERYDFAISSLDFYPTFANLAKAEVPENKKLEGKDVWLDFLANKEAHKDEIIYALRHRTGYSDVGARKGNIKILKTNQNTWEMYNVASDPGEIKDISEEHPELLKEMVLKTQEWSETHSEPKWFHIEEEGELWKSHNMPQFDKTFDLKNKP